MNILILIFSLIPLLGAGQKFYPDDPLHAEPKPRHVAEAKNRKLSDYFDLFSHQFGKLGERHPTNGPPILAGGVNTLGEPMEGVWWERRHYYRPMSREELQRGPGNTNQPSAEGKWTIVAAKTEGVTPGFSIRDSRNQLYFIKFDPLSNPEMATICDVVVSRIFYALGYHVPENNLVRIRPENLVIGEKATVLDRKGNPRPMTREDLDQIFIKVPRLTDGSYRATASLALPGKPIGPPRYFGTRADDPNDIVPHEHRRDLRGLHVFDAWLDHDDSRAINNLDILYKEGELQYIRHYQLDFGSTLGSGTQKANSPRSGSYFFSWKESAKQLFTLGMIPPYWAFAKYPKLPSIGRFEWKIFDPERWVPEYPNPAFLNRLPDDEFWGAKQVAAMRDDDLRALIEVGEISDPKASEWLFECLRERRDKIGRVYFSKVLPLDKFRMEAGKLRWEDLGAKYGYIEEAQVDLAWFAFDNTKQTRTPAADASSAGGPYRGVTLTHRTKTTQKIDVYLRGDEVVGIERHW